MSNRGRSRSSSADRMVLAERKKFSRRVLAAQVRGCVRAKGAKNRREAAAARPNRHRPSTAPTLRPGRAVLHARRQGPQRRHNCRSRPTSGPHSRRTRMHPHAPFRVNHAVGTPSARAAGSSLDAQFAPFPPPRRAECDSGDGTKTGWARIASPEDFMFQLTEEEVSALRSQIAISKAGRGCR